MDGFSSYNLLQIQHTDHYKTTFTTTWGMFAYNVMPFGLKNVGATFWRAMNYIFHHLAHLILTYLDDLTVRSKKFSDHLEDMCLVFQRCRQYNLCLKPLNCAFCINAKWLLGFIVSQQGIRVDPLKVQVIEKSHLQKPWRCCKACKVRPTYYVALSLIMHIVHMVSCTFFVRTSPFSGRKKLKANLIPWKTHFHKHHWWTLLTIPKTIPSTYHH